jgi:hypothetical protein
MIVGLWMTPAVLAGLFAILWVTTRLERLVVTPLVAGEFAHAPSVGTSAPIAARAATHASLDTSTQLEADIALLRQGEEGEPCTSEEERSS